MRTVDIYKSVDYVEIYNKVSIDINNISIDTRTINIGDCYFGIKGKNFDGNLFYKDAFRKGASLVILDTYSFKEEDLEYLKRNNKSILIVKDSTLALGQLAKNIRKSSNCKLVAVTGSSGKTSTKDMIHSVLSKKYNAHKTIGNKNNSTGLPMSLLTIKKNTEVIVLEMGMNHLGEISYLTSIAKPDIVVITNVGTAHIGNLGTRENILKAKLEILEGLKPNGIVVINNDNDLLHKWYIKNKSKYNIKTIGIGNESDYKAESIKESELGSTFTCNNESYEVNVGGMHFIYNSLVSIAIADIFKIPKEDVKEGIKTFKLSSSRMNIIKKDEIMIIDDSYNANFDSMKYAIKYLSSLNGRKIAILGDMKELGKYSSKLHKKIGEIIYEEKIDILITVGNDSKYINKESIKLGFNKYNSYHVNNNKNAINLIKKLKAKNDIFLVKASNSMHFKEIVNGIIF